MELEIQEKPKKKKRKKILIFIDIAIVLLVITGIALIVIPMIRNKQQTDVQKSILESLEKADEKEGEDTEIKTKMTIRRDYLPVPGEALENFGGTKKFVDPDKEKKGSDLIELNYFGIVTINKIGLKAPLAVDASRYSLRFGLGLYPDTPGLDDPGQSVIFGHRFITKGRDFNRLDEVGPGSIFYIDDNYQKRRHHYKVIDLEIIEPSELKERMYRSSENKTVLLVTCHPLNYTRLGDKRLLVLAEETKVEEITDTKSE